MINEEDMLRSVVRKNIKETLENMDIKPNEEQINEITELVLEDDNLWGMFNSEIFIIAEEYLKSKNNEENTNDTRVEE